MKISKWLISLLLILVVVAGCSAKEKDQNESAGSSSDGESSVQSGAVHHGVEDGKVGFTMSGGSIEEATGVPDDEKERLVALFNDYIDTLNVKDIDSYLQTLSKEDFNLEEERKNFEAQSAEYEFTREASEVTIIKYEENEAQIFSNIVTTFKQLSTGLVTKPSGRQVTVFKKINGDWKIASIHYIGDDE